MFKYLGVKHSSYFGKVGGYSVAEWIEQSEWVFCMYQKISSSHYKYGNFPYFQFKKCNIYFVMKRQHDLRVASPFTQNVNMFSFLPGWNLHVGMSSYHGYVHNIFTHCTGSIPRRENYTICTSRYMLQYWLFWYRLKTKKCEIKRRVRKVSLLLIWLLNEIEAWVFFIRGELY